MRAKNGLTGWPSRPETTLGNGDIPEPGATRRHGHPVKAQSMLNLGEGVRIAGNTARALCSRIWRISSVYYGAYCGNQNAMEYT